MAVLEKLAICCGFILVLFMSIIGGISLAYDLMIKMGLYTPEWMLIIISKPLFSCIGLFSGVLSIIAGTLCLILGDDTSKKTFNKVCKYLLMSFGIIIITMIGDYFISGEPLAILSMIPETLAKVLKDLKFLWECLMSGFPG